MFFKLLLLILFTTTAIANAANAAADSETAMSLDQVIDGVHRSDSHRARDQYRHPKQTLEFFGLRKDMTVIELWPGGGWYTEILAPFLKDSGKLIVASFGADAEPAYRANMHNELLEKLVATADLYGQVEVVVLAPPKHISLGDNNSVDSVLTFRNTHNWINDGVEQATYQAVYDVLKPGGIFGVVQHRGKDEWDPKASAKNGYVPTIYVVKMAEGVGFRLEGSSEINANPKDTKDHPEGVWTLPPRYRLDEQDKDKYTAIGESDRMTLMFVKPAD